MPPSALVIAWKAGANLTSTSITALRIPLAAWAAARYGSSGSWWTISLTAVARRGHDDDLARRTMEANVDRLRN